MENIFLRDIRGGVCVLGQEINEGCMETKLGKKWYACHLVITEERSSDTRMHVVDFFY